MRTRIKRALAWLTTYVMGHVTAGTASWSGRRSCRIQRPHRHARAYGGMATGAHELLLRPPCSASTSHCAGSASEFESVSPVRLRK